MHILSQNKVVKLLLDLDLPIKIFQFAIDLLQSGKNFSVQEKKAPQKPILKVGLSGSWMEWNEYLTISIKVWCEKKWH